MDKLWKTAVVALMGLGFAIFAVWGLTLQMEVNKLKELVGH
jgi:hypothetical protein